MEEDEHVSDGAEEDDDWILSRQSASSWVVKHFNAETRNTYRKFLSNYWARLDNILNHVENSGFAIS
jgi:hypothetical protein